jgi:spermidine synthase
LNLHSLPSLFDFPLDMARVPAEVNRLSNQVLVTTYEAEWGAWRGDLRPRLISQ